MSLLIKNGRVVTAERDEKADIFIEGDTVTAIGPSLPHLADVTLDASKHIVIPGGIDVHTHMDAPVGGTTSSDDFESGTRAAAIGGTTSIIDFATQSKGESLSGTLDRWWKKATPATIDYGFHMIIADLPGTKSGDLQAMVNAGVSSFKVFMAYPQSLMSDDATILHIMERSRDLGAMVCVHAENGAVIQYLVKRALAEGKTAPLYHALTRPPATEAEATHRALRLAELAHAPVYIVHVTCAESLKEIQSAVARGVRAYGETCPHYLLLSLADLNRPDGEGAKFVLTPPLRDASNHEPLWQALIRNDLQVVSTDHCPFFFRKQKLANATDFTRIPNGGPGVEHRLQLTYHYGVLERKMPLQRWVETISAAPARLFGLYPRKGTIAVGSDADLVLWNTDTTQKISASSHHMNVDYSMFEGFSVTGNADVVISRGEIIVRGGIWLGKPGRGKFLKRSAGGPAWG